MPVFRGRKLVLNYTDGSPCSPHSKRSLFSHEPRSLTARKLNDDDDDDKDDKDDDKDDNDGKDDKDEKDGKKGDKDKSPDMRRKSTIISLLCEKDPLAALASVAFVAASPDECTYFFEARSTAACGGIEVEQQSLGPGGVFGVMSVNRNQTSSITDSSRTMAGANSLQCSHRDHGVCGRWMCLPAYSEASAGLASASKLRHMGRHR